jgi:hypothetical protein
MSLFERPFEKAFDDPHVREVLLSWSKFGGRCQRSYRKASTRRLRKANAALPKTVLSLSENSKDNQLYILHWLISDEQDRFE